MNKTKKMTAMVGKMAGETTGSFKKRRRIGAVAITQATPSSSSRKRPRVVKVVAARLNRCAKLPSRPLRMKTTKMIRMTVSLMSHKSM